MSAYRQDIDGLRAVAVVPVVLYHAGFESISGGYVGVDIFFVISGFLITTLLLNDINAHNFRIRDFYARRARRLFPALFVMLAACCVPAYLWLMPEELEDFGQSLATTALFSSNFLFFSEAGYFEGPAELKPLLHTWSLAIEEQYYLLFPGFLLLIQRQLSAKFLRYTIILFVVSLAISIWSTASAPNAGFYLLPSRTWELLLGSSLAMWLAKPGGTPPAWFAELGALLGLLSIVIAVVGFDASTPFPGAAALLPCLGSALLIYTGSHHNTLPTRLLSSKPLVAVGLISYSLYLWHWPVLVFAQHYAITELTQTWTMALVGISVLLAWLSWRYIEQPFRGHFHGHVHGHRAWLNRRQLFQAAGACMAVTIAVGLVLDESEGLPMRLDAQTRAITLVANDKPASRKHCEGFAAAQVTFDNLCRINDSNRAPSLLIWGDSHAAAIMPAIKASSAAQKLNGLSATYKGCAPLLGVANRVNFDQQRCIDFNDAVYKLLVAHPEITTVVLSARWARYAESEPYQSESGRPFLLGNGATAAQNTEQNRDIFAQALTATVTKLAKLDRRLVVLGPIPEAGRDMPIVMAKAHHLKRALNLHVPRREFNRRQHHVLALLTDLAKQTPFELHRLDPQFCDAMLCRTSIAGLPIYTDDDHVASKGAKLVEPVLARIFANPMVHEN